MTVGVMAVSSLAAIAVDISSVDLSSKIAIGTEIQKTKSTLDTIINKCLPGGRPPTAAMRENFIEQIGELGRSVQKNVFKILDYRYCELWRASNLLLWDSI